MTIVWSADVRAALGLLLRLEYVNTKPSLEEDEVRWFFSQLLDGLSFCHGLGMYHRGASSTALLGARACVPPPMMHSSPRKSRLPLLTTAADLKLENLLLVSSPSDPERPERHKWESLVLKIADFGLSDMVGAAVGMEGLSNTHCGSPLYAAPELFSGSRSEGYDASKSDMWACGVVLYTLLTSALPFDADDMQALVRMVCKGQPIRPIPSSRCEAAAALVNLLLSLDPAVRPSAREAAEHEFIIPKKQPIASTRTTMMLPSLHDGVDALAPQRKTVSETAQFFKQMMAEEKAKAKALRSATVIEEAEAPSSDRRQPGSLLTKADLAAIRAEAATDGTA